MSLYIKLDTSMGMMLDDRFMLYKLGVRADLATHELADLDLVTHELADLSGSHSDLAS